MPNSYTIVDTSGNIINDPDYTKGRLIPKNDENLTLVYTTWEEDPDKDEDGNVIIHGPKPTVEEQIANLQDAITELYENLGQG